MRLILFDVEHGFCAFIRTPNGHTILIDCGKGSNFSPTEYLVRNELCVSLSKLIVSHAHEDHIEDFPRVVSRLNPSMLLAHDLNWQFIKDQNSLASHVSLEAYISSKDSRFTGGWVPDPNYGMRLESFSLTPNRAQQISGSINSAVNNCSIVTVASFPGSTYTPKFLFGGDMEEAGWDELLATNAGFRNAIRGMWFYFPSHHGHSSGFSTKLFATMGKPALNLISARHNDESRDGRYSSGEFSSGWPLKGDMRKMLSTTCDGSVFIDVDTTGVPHVSARFLPDNVQQAKSPAIFGFQDLLRRPGF